MLTVIGTNIRIPQGEDGGVEFAFKAKASDYPYILQQKQNDDIEAALLFEVRENISNKSKVVMAKYYALDNNAADDIDWYRFKTTVITPHTYDSAMKADYLYVKNTNGALEFVFKKDGDKETVYNYDYDNSSLAVTFTRSDTENLVQRTYYYEISYIEGKNLGNENEEIFIKTSLLEPTEFVVSGALK